MRLLRNVAIILAVAFILGPVGTCDRNLITLEEAIQWIAVGFGFAFVAWICHRVIVLREMARRKRARKSKMHRKENRYYA